MPTIINNPPNQGSNEGLGIGLVVGLLIVAFAGVLFFIYGLPALRTTGEDKPTVQKIEIQVPSPTPVVTTPTPEPAP